PTPSTSAPCRRRRCGTCATATRPRPNGHHRTSAGSCAGIRLAAEDASQLAIRSQAEAAAATDAGTAERHTRMAASAEALQPAYRRIEARLEEAIDDRRAWGQITPRARRLAVAADAQPPPRNPGKPIQPPPPPQPPPPDAHAD